MNLLQRRDRSNRREKEKRFELKKKKNLGPKLCEMSSKFNCSVKYVRNVTAIDIGCKSDDDHTS
jgi:hypothetical protein